MAQINRPERRPPNQPMNIFRGARASVNWTGIPWRSWFSPLLGASC